VPVDVVCGKEFAETAQATIKPVAQVTADDMIFDIGPETADQFAQLLRVLARLYGMVRLVFSSLISLAMAPRF